MLRCQGHPSWVGDPPLGQVDRATRRRLVPDQGAPAVGRHVQACVVVGSLHVISCAVALCAGQMELEAAEPAVRGGATMR